MAFGLWTAIDIQIHIHSTTKIFFFSSNKMVCAVNFVLQFHKIINVCPNISGTYLRNSNEVRVIFLNSKLPIVKGYTKFTYM